MSIDVAAAPPRGKVMAAFAVIYLVWGSTFLGIRVAVETIPPLTMAAVRFIISGGILMLLSLGARPRATFRQWLNASLVGGLFFLGNHGLVSSAARYLPSSLVCLIVATEVPVIALLSSVLLPQQPLTWRSLVGAGFGIVGVLCLFGDPAQGVHATMLLPCLAVLAASLSWSLGAVMTQKLDLPPDPLLRAAMQMTSGGVMLGVASLLKGEPWTVNLPELSLRSIGALAYLIVFGSVLAFACYTWLLRHVRTQAVATHAFVNPLVAVAVGTWLGGEKLHVAQLVSGLFILVSVWVITVSPRPGRAKPGVDSSQRWRTVARADGEPL